MYNYVDLLIRSFVHMSSECLSIGDFVVEIR